MTARNRWVPPASLRHLIIPTLEACMETGDLQSGALFISGDLFCALHLT